ncbi:MAG: hypothetical protein ACO23O_15960, partial [Ilumatobacteraceae bacterium]
LKLMKLDALGLKTLDVVQEALDMTGGKITDIDIEAPDFQRMAEIVGEVRLALATGVPSGF